MRGPALNLHLEVWSPPLAALCGGQGDSAPSSLPTSWFKPPRLIFSFVAALENKRGRRADPLKYTWRRRRTRRSSCIIKHIYSYGARHVRAFQRLLSSRVCVGGGGRIVVLITPFRSATMCAPVSVLLITAAPPQTRREAPRYLPSYVWALEWRLRLLHHFV